MSMIVVFLVGNGQAILLLSFFVVQFATDSQVETLYFLMVFAEELRVFGSQRLGALSGVSVLV